MMYIVRGHLSLTRALDEGRLEAEDPRALRSRLRAWLNLRPLTKLKSQRADGAIARTTA